MNTQQLRLGNIVWDGYSGHMIVAQIEKDSLLLQKGPGMITGKYDSTGIVGLRLNEDVMIAAGFKQDVDKFISPQFGNRSFYFTKDSTGCFFIVFNMYLSVTIRYLHELQNLVHVLTGEELIIDL